MASFSSHWCLNQTMFVKFMKTVREELADVNFVFNSNNVTNDNNTTGPPAKKVARRGKSAVGGDVGNVVKISANKKILAASSPVFNAMFNGPLKETGDVKIADVSPDAFREFLQLFYGSGLYLTAKNLDEVMKLIDKYDVKDGWSTVDTVFKRFNVDDILWGLHLAVKYQRADLITHCTTVIEQNRAKVCDMIEFDDSGKPKLRSNPNERPISDADLANIYSRIHTTIKKYISESVPGIFALKLQQQNVKSLISLMQDISFSLNRTLHLTRITCAAIYANNIVGGRYEVKVNIAGAETCHRVISGGGSFKFVNPVLIQANRKYTIQTTIVTKLSSEAAFDGHKIPSEPVQLTPNIQIMFDKPHSNSFVAGMNFSRYDQ